MSFGTDNLQYGSGFTDEEFGSAGAGYTGLSGPISFEWGDVSVDFGGDEGYGALYGGSIYDEYREDMLVSDKLDVKDYLFTYDPLKEQNLLADYMSGLVDFGDKTEGVRTKAIEERKALSKSVRGGLTSASMVESASKQKEAASKAQADLYRGQASTKRALGQDIGSLREEYEADIAQSVDAYNEKVGGTGLTIGESEIATKDYMSAHNVGPGGDIHHSIQTTSAPATVQNSVALGEDQLVTGDTWLNSNTGQIWEFNAVKENWGTWTLQ